MELLTLANVKSSGAEPDDSPDKPYARLGYRLARARDELDWSQRRLAAYVGKSPGTVANYETGVARPSTKSLRILARWLGLDYNDLAVLARYTDAPATGEPIVAPKSYRDILARLVTKYSPEQLSRLERVAAELLLDVHRQPAGGKGETDAPEQRPEPESDGEHLGRAQ